jgi:hypothetical protein
MVRTFREWKSQLILFLTSIIDMSEKDRPFIENLIQRLPQLRLSWLPRYLADLALLRRVVDIPPHIFPTPEEIDLWFKTKQEE